MNDYTVKVFIGDDSFETTVAAPNKTIGENIALTMYPDATDVLCII
jgi:hypothetical protein